MMDTEIDRISNLPDEMLYHIVSFLPTKEAVQKSMISKRWTNLWASISRLNFDETDFVNGSTRERYAKFAEFDDMVLNHRESSYIHTVQMRFHHDYSFCDLVRTLISSCKKFNPRVLSIEVPLPFHHFLHFMFACESVEDMSLKITRFRDWSCVPKTINLPRIKKLFLNKTLVEEDSLTRLLSGCLVLEDLSLEMCLGEFSSIFRRKITSLSLVDCCDFTQQRAEWELILSDVLPDIVDLPCITRLKIRNACLDEQSIHKLLTGCPLLEELTLEDCHGKCSNLFGHNIKCLSLINCSVGTSQESDSEIFSDLVF